MKHVLIIGSGLSGLSCAIELAEKGIHSTLVSPYSSERAQSVMAAGGINAAIGADDSVEQHAEDTLNSGGSIAGKEVVTGLCLAAPEIIRQLEGLGVVFSRNEDGKVALRAFGGQSRNRTAYAGASTGKQIMSALIRVARKHECCNIINRLLGRQFHSALIKDNKCYGALLYNEKERKTETIYASGHIAGDWKVTRKATCTETGLKVQKCKTCNTKLREEIISALGHTASEWQVTKKATCIENGVEIQNCLTF